MDDDAIRALLSRLARPHSSGGKVIERAAMLAEGADFPELIAWINAHHGEPESVVPRASASGLHGSRMSGSGGRERAPQRYVLQAGELT
jgi:hypothetical protein